jgi:hypothetical protein
VLIRQQMSVHGYRPAMIQRIELGAKAAERSTRLRTSDLGDVEI